MRLSRAYLPCVERKYNNKQSRLGARFVGKELLGCTDPLKEEHRVVGTDEDLGPSSLPQHLVKSVSELLRETRFIFGPNFGKEAEKSC